MPALVKRARGDFGKNQKKERDRKEGMLGIRLFITFKLLKPMKNLVKITLIYKAIRAFLVYIFILSRKSLVCD